MSADQLRRQRGQLKAKLTAATNFVNRIAEDVELTTQEEVESRLRNLEEAYVKFQTIVQQLIVTVPEEEYEARDSTEETEFDERYFSVKASLLQVIKKFKPESLASTSSNGNQENDGVLSQVLEQQATLIRQLSDQSNEASGGGTLSQILEQQMRILERLSAQSGSVREPQVKLPIIKLPTFNGTIEEWKRYADTFKNLIHDSELSNVQKHQYLVGSLSGPAAKIIESIDISDQNYEIAWELLKKRYEDERAIRKRHIQCLFELPRVHRESATAIQELLDHVHKHLRVLQSMKLPTESWGELIIYLIEKNLDSSTRGRWEEHIEQMTDVTTSTMTDFLQRRCQVLKRASLNETKDLTSRKNYGHEKGDGNKRGSFHANSQPKTSLSTIIQGGRCYWCQGQHLIYTCSEFLRLPAEDRLQEVKRRKLCINCLRNDHLVKECGASSCRKCGERHNTLCHPMSEGTSSTTNSTRKAMGNSEKSSGAAGGTLGSDRGEARVSDSASGASVCHVLNENRRKEVLMSTAIVNVRGGKGQLRILLDSASETNFITMEACKKLNLKLEDIHESINGLNDMNCVINYGCRLQIQSRTSDFNVNVCCLVVPKITKFLPSSSIRASQLSIPENLKLADPFFANPGKIDALIGAEFFMSILQTGKIELGKDLPTLQNSKFGWIISGSISETFVVSRSINRHLSNAHTCLFTRNETIDDTLLKFWELEEYQGNQNSKLSTEEQACENHFVNTLSRDASGRFIVRLPLRTNKDQLGESREIAIKRLRYLERKFQRDQEFYKQYSNFMREYIELNHMSKITDSCDTNLPTYLPHHGVLRESSATTKLRVVFDGSAKTTSGISLNDTLMVGATLQDNIIDIILRFRLHAIAITADLRKMYRQILVHEQDRNYQRIVWRFSSSDPIQDFQLNTVTYGLACAPFLAIRCVRQLAGDAIRDFSEASRVLLNDLYVDDILTGVKDKTDAINLISQLKILLNSGGFELHKLHSNCKEIVNSVAAIESGEESSSVAIDIDTVKTLGLNWNPERDIFHFTSQLTNDSIKTKREVLSAISRLFDPLGLISPISIRAKLIMQGTWSSKLDWDDQLPHELQQAWDVYENDLREIHAIEIPRRVISCSNANQFYLHAFCDASLKAYGACVYLQTIDGDNNCVSNLLCSKSRVAPVKNKTITIPKLELCGAVVLTRLIKCVIQAMKIELNGIYAWSDSTITLAWISGDPSRQGTFVSNRTAEIQNVVPAIQWRHVSGTENPADLISRGTGLHNLKQCKLWWEGPEWLSNFDNYSLCGTQLANLSPEEMAVIHSEEMSESRVVLSTNNSRQAIQTLLNNHSSLSTIERIVAWIFRFISNAKLTNHTERNRGYLTIGEVCNARRVLIIAVQQTHFANELTSIRNGGHVKSNSKLLPLDPFLDERGILRVGGRLKNSLMTFDKRHPILLPSKDNFTKLLFQREHLRLLHAGPQALLYSTRQKYWTIGGKNVARKIVHNCVICFRNKPKALSQLMGQLPADRVIPKRPFFVTGVDFAGPIITLVNKGRGRKTIKSYISLFICFSTKAIHLEAVSELSSASFIAALRRFVGRRGCPQRIYSDNATNFVGARNEIDEMQQLIKGNVQEINKELCSPNNIEWKFIPPSSPHMGGIWEAGVKSCKFHLKRIIGEKLLTFEELTTVLIQIEACLNSRPICQLPSTPTDLQPLTPGHFLIGESLTDLVDVDVSDVPVNRLDRWQLVQKITREFWSRWSKEYLTSLQSRSKWRTERSNIAINDIVLIQDNNSAPLKWKLGKVIETHKGTDNNVRVVTLKTASGICKRAISKLCKLPISDDN